VTYGLGIEEHDQEGRVITLEYKEFYLITVYTPNSQDKLARIDYRMQWENDFRSYMLALEQHKPVIVCGDLNVAHTEIDLKNPKTNVKNAGFSPQEREQMSKTLESGYIDSFRHLNPSLEGAYSWWSYRFNSRAKNAGWRIDYFLISNQLENHLKDADIHAHILGSDHCPVVLELSV
ncbi:MAG: exodeoxyribonuclease III, partial [Turicibacter sp.]